MRQYSANKIPSEVLLMVAANFRTLRKQKKMSQQKMAERSGVPLITIKRFEANGKIALESLLKLAYGLDALDGFDKLFQLAQLPDDLEQLFSDKTRLT